MDQGILHTETTFTINRPVNFINPGTFDSVGTLTLQGPVTGAGTLIKTGAGILRNTNVRIGAMTINAGTVATIAGGGSLGTSSVQTLSFGGTLAAPVGALDLSVDFAAGDIISAITRFHDDKGTQLPQPQVTPTKGLALNAAVKLILGQPATDVKLTIVREGVEKPFEVEITRGKIEVESVLGFKRQASDDWDYMIDPKSKIVVVHTAVHGTQRDPARGEQFALFYGVINSLKPQT